MREIKLMNPTENLENKEMKRRFDAWCITFGVKDGCGTLPDFESLIRALFYYEFKNKG